MNFTYTEPINQTDLYMNYVLDNMDNTEILESNQIKYWLPNQYRETLIACLDDKERIVGLIGLEQSPHRGQDDLLWVKFVSVRGDMQRQGVATELIRRGFEYAKEHHKSLLNSSYSEMGEKSIKSVFARISTEYPQVPFYENEQCAVRGSPFNEKYCARAVEERLGPS